MNLDGRLLAVVQAIGADIKALFSRQASLIFVIDGGGVAVVAGSQVEFEIPGNLQPQSWTITADAAGSAVVDILRATYANYPTFSSVAGTEKPTLSTAQKNQDLSLTTWNTTWSAGDIIRANVDSATTVKRIMVTVRCKRV